jgi:hypothetical protein
MQSQRAEAGNKTTIIVRPDQKSFLRKDDYFPRYLCLMPYPTAPTTFDELVRLIPPRGANNRYRFTATHKPFELEIGRNETNIVQLSFSAPGDRTTFWPCIRTVESLTSQRAIWSHWQRFLEDPESYLTWKHIGNSAAA